MDSFILWCNRFKRSLPAELLELFKTEQEVCIKTLLCRKTNNYFQHFFKVAAAA